MGRIRRVLDLVIAGWTVAFPIWLTALIVDGAGLPRVLELLGLLIAPWALGLGAFLMARKSLKPFPNAHRRRH